MHWKCGVVWLYSNKIGSDIYMHWNTCAGNVACPCGYLGLTGFGLNIHFMPTFQMLGKGSQGFKLYDASICAVLEGLIPLFLSENTSQTWGTTGPWVPEKFCGFWRLGIIFLRNMPSGKPQVSVTGLPTSPCAVFSGFK